MFKNCYKTHFSSLNNTYKLTIEKTAFSVKRRKNKKESINSAYALISIQPLFKTMQDEKLLIVLESKELELNTGEKCIQEIIDLNGTSIELNFENHSITECYNPIHLKITVERIDGSIIYFCKESALFVNGEIVTVD